MSSGRFFFFGTDYFRVIDRARQVVRDCESYEIEIISSEATKISDCVDELRRVNEALRTVSLFSVKKLVWYKDVSFLQDGTLLKSPDVDAWLSVLFGAIEGLQDTVFLLTSRGADQRQKAVKWFVAHCKSERFDALQENDCELYVKNLLKQNGKTISSDALERFLRRIGGDSAVIDTELQKLLTYVGEKTVISLEDIEAITVDLRENDFFETIDAFFSSDPQRYADSIRRYFSYQEEGRPLLAALQNRVRLLMQLAYLHEKNGLSHVTKLSREQCAVQHPEAKGFGVFAQNPWYAGKLFSLAQQRSFRDWGNLQIRLLRAIYELPQHYRDQSVVFDSLYFYSRMQQMQRKL